MNIEFALKYYGIDWLWYGASLLAIYLLGKKNRYGFLSMVISDVAGLFMAYATGSAAGFFGSIIYIVLSLWGWRHWTREGCD